MSDNLSKPRKKTGGRQKGTPNKFTKNVKDMVLGALDRVGGENYLVEVAHENPTAFLSLVRQLMPKNIQVEGLIKLEDLVAGANARNSRE